MGESRALMDGTRPMASDPGPTNWTWRIIVILILLGAVYVATAVVVPVAFALFVNAMI